MPIFAWLLVFPKRGPSSPTSVGLVGAEVSPPALVQSDTKRMSTRCSPPPQRLTHSVCKVAWTTHCFYCSQYPGVLAGDRILIYVSCTKGLFYFFKHARLWPRHRCYFMCRFLQRLKIARHQNRLCCTQCWFYSSAWLDSAEQLTFPKFPRERKVSVLIQAFLSVLWINTFPNVIICKHLIQMMF